MNFVEETGTERVDADKRMCEWDSGGRVYREY